MLTILLVAGDCASLFDILHSTTSLNVNLLMALPYKANMYILLPLLQTCRANSVCHQYLDDEKVSALAWI